MFDYERMIKRLENFDNISKSKQRKVVEELLTDKEVPNFLYRPKDIPNLSEVVSAFYTGLTKTSVLRNIVRFIEDEGYDEFNRTYACFFYAIVSIAIESANELASENADKRKDGEISNREFREKSDKIDEYVALVNRLFKLAKKIVKSEAKELSDDTNIPFKLARLACLMVPDKQYIDHHKIGSMLYLLLEEWYDNIDDVESVSALSIRWKGVFRHLFGKENLPEVATYLLLEGHSRKDKKCKSARAEKLWDSLTEFALYQINEAPEQVRDHMLELYIKKVSRMFTNGTYELRVDLLSLPDMSGKTLSNLASSITKYRDKLETVFASR